MTARSGSLTATDFTYAGLASQFVLESTQEQKSTEEGSAPPQLTAYLYDMNGSPLARYNAGRPYAFLKNAHHDIVGHLNESGSLAEKIDTTVFGSSDTDQTLAFQGQYADPDTDLSHLNARLYNADTAQFLSPDPFPGLTDTPYSLNKYAYAHNDPVNYWDESGMYGSEVHYDLTYKLAKDAAESVKYAGITGFNAKMAELIALNIASFDQYHDKDRGLAPNNYSANGMGNDLHFLNPKREQLWSHTSIFTKKKRNPFNDFDVQVSIMNNQYVDPLALSVNTNTSIPIPDSRSIVLPKGTVEERLQFAVSNHDPRLLGIALHEYQDTFAHAGYTDWHGFSSSNDLFCIGPNPPDACSTILGKAITGLKATVKLSSLITSYEDKQSLDTRDWLMQQGTTYWLDKFMMESAKNFEKSIQEAKKTQMSYNKEEKMLNNPVERLGVMEEAGDWAEYAVGGVTSGAPCFDIILDPLKENKGNCGTFLLDLFNPTIR